jgi:hypothetical protein
MIDNEINQNPEPQPITEPQSVPQPETINPKPEPSTPDYRKPNGKGIGEERSALIQALHSMGVPKSVIADKLDLSRTTVHFIAEAGINNPELVEQVKKRMSAKWWLLASNAVSAITAEKLMDSSAAQLAMVAGIATDKARLIDGEPTAFIGFIDKSDGEIQAEIDDRVKRLAALRATPIDVQIPSPDSASPPL